MRWTSLIKVKRTTYLASVSCKDGEDISHLFLCQNRPNLLPASPLAVKLGHLLDHESTGGRVVDTKSKISTATSVRSVLTS
jgi:hypothetical protein